MPIKFSVYYFFKFELTLRISNPMASSRFSVFCKVVFNCRLNFCISDIITVHVSTSSVSSVSVNFTKYCGLDQYCTKRLILTWVLEFLKSDSKLSPIRATSLVTIDNYLNVQLYKLLLILAKDTRSSFERNFI